MRKFNKSTAIILSILLFVVLAVGFVFSFVPIQFSKHKFISLSNTLNLSTELVGGVYGEYDIKTENPSDSDIIESLAIIRSVFEEDGYKNVNVYAVGKSKVKIEISYPKGKETFANVYTKLKTNVGAGAFSLSSDQTIAEETIVIDGAKHIKEVKVSMNNDSKFIQIIFNKQGRELYKEICTTQSSIYLRLGEYTQSISLSGVSDYSSLTLSNTDWDNMIALEQKIKLGCTKIELDGTNAIVNTMSAFNNTAFVVSFAALIFIAVLIFAIFTIRFGLFGIIALISMLIGTYLYLFIAWLVPSFELGISVVLSIAIGAALIFTFAFNFAKSVKDEYNMGKSLQAALESSYKKSILGEVIINVMLFISSLILTALSFSELTSVAISFTILSALSLFINLCLIPLLVKIGISSNSLGRKLFLLKKRNNLAGLDAKEDK